MSAFTSAFGTNGLGNGLAMSVFGQSRLRADEPKIPFLTQADFPSCSFLSRNEFRVRKANEQLRYCISGHGFAE